MVLTLNLQYYSPIVLKYSGAPLKMLLEVIETGSSELSPATKTSVYIIKPAQYKTNSKSVHCQGRSNKNLWQSCGLDTFFPKCGRGFKGIGASAFLFWCQAVVSLGEVNLPWRDLSEYLSLACIYSFWHQKPYVFHTVKQHCLQMETAPTWELLLTLRG